MNINQRVYISGPVDDPCARRMFSTAQSSLIGEGYEPVNFLSDMVHPGVDLQDHIADDLQLLLSCANIYMLAGWEKSKESRIALKIAEESDMNIMFQQAHDAKVYPGKELSMYTTMLKAAIREVIGVDFDQYEETKKSSIVFFTRMIFSFHCRKFGMQLKQIKAFVHRDHTTILHYLKKYKEEYKFNNEFRQYADRIVAIMAEYEQNNKITPGIRTNK